MMDLKITQPTLDTLKLKKDKNIDYVPSLKSQGIYICKRKPLYAAFLHSTKFCRYSIGKKIDRDLLALEQNNYTTKSYFHCL